MFKLKTRIRQRHTCPVCGYAELESPPDNFTICPSCGVEFGYQTSGRSFYELRQEWIATGAHWSSRVDKRPKAWNSWLQLIKAGYSMSVPWQAQISVQMPQPVVGQKNISHRPIYVVQAI